MRNGSTRTSRADGARRRREEHVGPSSATALTALIDGTHTFKAADDLLTYDTHKHENTR